MAIWGLQRSSKGMTRSLRSQEETIRDLEFKKSTKPKSFTTKNHEALNTARVKAKRLGGCIKNCNKQVRILRRQRK